MLLKLMKARKAVPQKLLDTCAFIEDLLGEDAWQAKLKKHHKLLTDVFSKLHIEDLQAFR
jgi:hypothetical protein